MSAQVRLSLKWINLDQIGEKTLGTPLKTIDGIKAWCVQSRSKMSISAGVSVTGVSISEVRWLFGRLVDQIKALYPIGQVQFSRGRAASLDVYEALALDLTSRYPDIKLSGLGVRVEETKRLACLEAGYRQWVDEDPTLRTSLQIAEDILNYATTTDSVDALVLTETELKTEGLHLHLAVGGASKKSPPRLVIATYGDPTPDNAPLMLVGKGITFDSGGINVKPYTSFVSMMKNDMGGAALAWHLFKGLVASDFPQPVVCVIPTCENPIGEEAMRPGSVVTGHRGVSVRIDHTDAEGRLILADAISWASETYQPTEVITFATLTTSALNSYGPFATPVHFANERLQQQLHKASNRCGEDLHFFPSRVWHREANKDHEAELRNTGRLSGHASAGAGSRNAAHFLRFFTDAPLTHLDIFASTWDWSGQSPAGTRSGATGTPLRTLLNGLNAYAHSKI
jgi:leucyl aminopeptidase